MSFGFSVSPGPAAGVAAEAARAEALGFDRIGIWDSPALFRESWVTLAAVAGATERIRLGTWVTNPLSRHPVVTASAIATLDELAPGRTYLGIGAGGTGVWHLGMKAARLAVLEEYVHAVRSLLRDGRAAWEGRDGRLDWGAGRSIPIVLSAHGPRSLELAGRVADGVVVGLGVTPEVVRSSLEVLERSAREAGRTLADIEVWFTCFWFVEEEPGAAAEKAAWAATAFALHFARWGVDGRFVPDEHRDGVVALGQAYDLGTHGAVPPEQQARYARLAEELGVGEYLRRRFVFSGTPDEVESQVRAAMDAGARNFDGAIDAELPEHEERITKWARLVLPRFGKGPA
ncbi:MAG TPA: LLM class flavin-dependent oxidoreductase [Gaiellaceae bacterium]|nr:LLM class flavin-dependent oxidoreductase [Gaiellaceae bacterium]